MHRIVFLDRATLAVDLPRPAFPHEWVEHPFTAPADVAGRAAGATIVVTNKVRLDASVLEVLPALRFVAVAATGVDIVDLDACRRRGVEVSNARGYASRSVAEHVVACVLALARRLLDYVAAVDAGDWSRSPTFTLHAHRIGELAGATFGVVGHGEIGRTTADLARALGAHVLVAERRGAAPRPGRLAFDEVLARADVLSLHCPLTPETRALLGAVEFARMPRGAILVNTARGALVDDPSLVAALRSGQLGGAAIDVLDAEPPPAGHPLLVDRPPNLLVTPHVAWASRQAQTALAEQIRENLEAFVAGRPLRSVLSR